MCRPGAEGRLLVNLMLYPDCPKCGSKKVSSALPDQYGLGRAGRGMGTIARGGAFLAPVAAAMAAGISVAGVVMGAYVRVPGGGEKRCADCNNVFR